MVSRKNRAEEYELLPRKSQDSVSSFDSSSEDHPESPSSIRGLRSQSTWHYLRLPWRTARSIFFKVHRHRRSRELFLRSFCWAIVVLLSFTIVLIIFTFAFRPSYTHLPDHYQALQKRCRGSQELGRGNINNEKVLIAAALYDPGGSLLGKDWGRAVAELVELLGPQNVHLSIHENDADSQAKAALVGMRERVKCNTSLVSEHFALEDVPRVTTPSGESRIGRIAFLAELLYLNDVIFNPVDAVNLIFSTNSQPSGHAQYQAACAVDFINAFKFYDRFATRDIEGYTSGIPFYPWFTDAGKGLSRWDVLEQKDAVRVRSCWGGMVAFDAKPFQDRHPEVVNGSSEVGLAAPPLRFRYDEDPFWEASECCLIHADLAYINGDSGSATDSAIFMNPYIRVAYDQHTLRWLPYIRRVERLFSLVHNLLNHAVGMPEYNPRRLEQPGEEVVEKVWKPDDGGNASGNLHQGSYQELKRIARPGRFCGIRRLMVLIENPKKGQKNWESLPLPPVP